MPQLPGVALWHDWPLVHTVRYLTVWCFEGVLTARASPGLTERSDRLPHAGDSDSASDANIADLGPFWYLTRLLRNGDQLRSSTALLAEVEQDVADDVGAHHACEVDYISFFCVGRWGGDTKV